MQLAVPQKHLGPRGFFFCVLAINLLIILSIDMYVPALPSMQKEFGVTAGFLNLTMFSFFLVSAVGIVIAGPLSDRRGRKPVLVGGCALFAAATLLCMLAPSVELLVAFRAAEALGYGFITAVVTALIKDAYRDNDLKKAMTALQSLIIIGPAFAPFLGTLFLGLGGWRVIFAFLTVCAFAGLGLACLIGETHAVPRRSRAAAVPDMVAKVSAPALRNDGAAALLSGGGKANAAEGLPFAEGSPVAGAADIPERADALQAERASARAPQDGSLRAQFRTMGLLARDRGFLSLALLMGVAGIPYFAFIAVVSYVLFDFFAVSYLEYSLIYAAACVVAIVAPYAYMALSKRLGTRAILRLSCVLVAVSFALMLAVGQAGPWLFLLAFVPYALAEGIVRPLSFVELLNQPRDRVGAASSFANFCYSLLTSFATVLATLEWPNLVVGIIAITGATAVLMALLYAWGQRKGCSNR